MMIASSAHKSAQTRKNRKWNMNLDWNLDWKQSNWLIHAAMHCLGAYKKSASQEPKFYKFGPSYSLN